MVCDPAAAKPWAMVWAAVTPHDVYICFDEYPLTFFWDTPTPDWGAKGYVEMIKAFEEGDNFWGRPIRNVLWRLIDPAFAHTMSAHSGRKLEDDLADYGMLFETDIDRDVTSGHLAVRQRFESNTLLMTPNCRNLIHAVQRYNVDERRRPDGPGDLSEKPRDGYKDQADLLRYLCKFAPRYISTEPQKQVEMSPMGL